MKKIIKIALLVILLSYNSYASHILEVVKEGTSTDVGFPVRRGCGLFSFDNYIGIVGGVGYYDDSDDRWVLSDTILYDLQAGLFIQVCDGSINTYEEGEYNFHYCLPTNRCPCYFGEIITKPVIHRGLPHIINPTTNINPTFEHIYDTNYVYALDVINLNWVRKNDPPWDNMRWASLFSNKSYLWLVGGKYWDSDLSEYVWNHNIYKSVLGTSWSNVGEYTGLPSSNFYSKSSVLGGTFWLVGYVIGEGGSKETKSFYSENCINWTEGDGTGLPEVLNNNFSLESWDNKLWLFFTDNGVDYIYFSYNGNVWEEAYDFVLDEGAYNRTWFSTCVRPVGTKRLDSGIIIACGAGDESIGYNSGYSNDILLWRECREGDIERMGSVISICNCTGGYTDMGVLTYSGGYSSEETIYVDISIFSDFLTGEMEILEEGLILDDTYTETYFYDNYGNKFFDEYSINLFFQLHYNIYRITYYFYDECGNPQGISRTILVEDTQDLVNNGEDSYAILYSSTWEDPGLTLIPSNIDVSDDVVIYLYKKNETSGLLELINEGGDSWEDSVVSDYINTNGVGTYESWYYYEDSCESNLLSIRYITGYGNSSGVLILGGSNFDIECSSYSESDDNIWEDPGVIALDDGGVIDNDADITVIIYKYEDEEWSVVLEETEFDDQYFYDTFSSIIGEYKIEYHYTDSLSSEHTTKRLINVVDNIPPEIELIGNSRVTVECGDIFVDPGAIPYLDCGSPSVVESTSNVDLSSIGIYEITYTLPGALPVTRIVEVVDSIPPEITLIGPEIHEIVSWGAEIPEEYNEIGYVAYDSCNGDVTALVQVDNEYTESDTLEKNHAYKITYSSFDYSGNVSTKERWVVVKESKYASTGMVAFCRFDLVKKRMICYNITPSEYIVNMFTLEEAGFTGFNILSNTFKVVYSDFYFQNTDDVTSFLDKCLFIVHNEDDTYLFYGFIMGNNELHIVDACLIDIDSKYNIIGLSINDSGGILMHLNSYKGTEVYEAIRENNEIKLLKVSDFDYSNSSVLPLSSKVGGINSYSEYRVPVGFQDKSTSGIYKVNSWDWYFDDGYGSKDKNPMHIFKWPNDYSVRLSVSTGVTDGNITKSVQVGTNMLVYGVLNRFEIRVFGKTTGDDFKEGYGGFWKVTGGDVVLPITEYAFPMRTNTFLVRGKVTVTPLESSNWTIYNAVLKINGDIYNDSIDGSFNFNTGSNTGYVYELDVYYTGN